MKVNKIAWVYCSVCNKKVRRNKTGKCFVHANEDKKGISPKNLLLINSNKKGSGNPMWGRKRSAETRKKSSESLKQFYQNNQGTRVGAWTGDKNPRWKGGITPKLTAIRNSKEFILWRLSVYKRDDYTCQKCYTRGGSLHSHHIMSFADNSDLRLKISNGITLCQPCHTKFHSRYGKSNNNHIQLSEFLSII